MNYPRIIKVTTISISLLLFISSLTQPAFYTTGSNPEAWSDSTGLLLLGWMGFLGGSIESLLWIANPIYFLTIITYIKNKSISKFTGWIAVALAFAFYLIPDIMTSESGRREKIVSYENGYKLWLISMIVLAMGIMITIFIENKRNANNG